MRRYVPLITWLTILLIAYEWVVIFKKVSFATFWDRWEFLACITGAAYVLGIALVEYFVDRHPLYRACGKMNLAILVVRFGIPALSSLRSRMSSVRGRTS